MPPELEGVRFGDRYGVIFSQFDLSCALEKRDSLECRGYTREDAARIGLNVLLYAHALTTGAFGSTGFASDEIGAFLSASLALAAPPARSTPLSEAYPRRPSVRRSERQTPENR